MYGRTKRRKDEGKDERRKKEENDIFELLRSHLGEIEMINDILQLDKYTNSGGQHFGKKVKRNEERGECLKEASRATHALLYLHTIF